jgi:thiamine biosynthesis lipoprotein
MKYFAIFLLTILFSCGKSETRIEGERMGMAYKVLFREKVAKASVEKLIDTIFYEIDTKLNRWNKDSELAKWNSNTSIKPIPASFLFVDLARRANLAYQLTHGLYDPSLGSVIHAWKMSLRLGSILTSAEVNSYKKCSGWKKVIIHEEAIEKLHPNLELDFDGILKGYFCDLLSEELKKIGYNNFLVEWAGEIKVTGGPFKILAGKEILSLTNQSIATSGPTYQLYPILKDGKTIFYSHFVNPKTLQALTFEDPTLSKSIVHPSALYADALATAAVIK